MNMISWAIMLVIIIVLAAAVFYSAKNLRSSGCKGCCCQCGRTSGCCRPDGEKPEK